MEAGLWCPDPAEPLQVHEWLAGPRGSSPLQVLMAILLWVGIPAASIGLLSWLPAAVAAEGRARAAGSRAQRQYERTLRTWQAEDDLRRFALWCADTLLHGGRPAYAAPIILRRGESLLWSGSAHLIEPRRAPGHYQGGSAGVSVPLGLGIRANVGSHRGTYVPGPEVQAPVDSGAAAVTSARVVFTGQKKTREWSLAKLVSIQQSADGKVALLPVTNRQAVSGVHVGADTARFGTAMEIAAAAQSGSLPRLREELQAHLDNHQLTRPQAPALR